MSQFAFLQREWTAVVAAPGGTEASFFRTAPGAEVDLLLKLPGERKPWALPAVRRGGSGQELGAG